MRRPKSAREVELNAKILHLVSRRDNLRIASKQRSSRAVLRR